MIFSVLHIVSAQFRPTSRLVFQIQWEDKALTNPLNEEGKEKSKNAEQNIEILFFNTLTLWQKSKNN